MISTPPHAIPRGDALGLARALVAIDSRNPSLDSDGPGEAAAATFLAETLAAWGFKVDLLESSLGRPNVIARIGGGHGGRSLMLNGHLDTVGVAGMTHDPWSPDVRDGRLYGRGSTDMKSGIAAMCAAAARAAARPAGLGGEVIIAAVTDEEFASDGTRTLLEAGVTAHAAIVTEPTRLAICPAHRGFAWADVVVHGHAAHGSRYDIGVDAVMMTALLLAELETFQRETLASRTHPLVGHASLHAGVIRGGSGISTYPERCEVSLERRTLPGELSPGSSFAAEIEAACDRVRGRESGFRADVLPGISRAPNDVAADHPIVVALAGASRQRGHAAPVEGLSCWTDAAMLTAAGIPAICYGPGDIALAHAAEEYVLTEEIAVATDVLESLVIDWCGPKGVAWGS
ncbi:MAG: ArgE/DapE family deacylase [Gemmatimonadaceae bacterium]